MNHHRQLFYLAKALWSLRDKESQVSKEYTKNECFLKQFHKSLQK